MFYLAFALILAFQAVWGKSCNRYQCSTTSNLCASQSGDIITVDDTVCTNNTYCDFETDSDYDIQGSCEAPYKGDRLPGSKCTEDSECYESSCVNNVCKGKSSGEACDGRKQCDVGLYCDLDAEVCKSLKVAGDDCEYYWECNYGYGCDDNIGKCTKYYSIAVGSSQKVECYNRYSSMCEYGSCAYDGEDYYCTDPFSYNNTGDIIQCHSDSDCIATSGNYTYEFECNCGSNPDGIAYCELLPSSSYFEDYISFYKSWMTSSTAKKSHRIEEMSVNLIDYGSSSELEDYTKNVLYGLHADYFYNAQDCVINVYLGQFSDYYDSSSLALAFTAGLYLVIS